MYNFVVSFANIEGRKTILHDKEHEVKGSESSKRSKGIREGRTENRGEGRMEDRIEGRMEGMIRMAGRMEGRIRMVGSIN